MLPDLEPRAIDAAAIKAEVSKSVVSYVVNANNMQIRKIRERGYDCLAEIQMEIQSVAKEYGARVGIDNVVLDECTRFILEKFPMIAVSEIRAAYRAWASGEITPENAEMYGGVMDVRQLGKILSCWVEYRNKIYWAYLRQVDEIEKEKKEAQRIKEASEKFERELPQLVEEYRAKCKSWQDVPAFIYEVLSVRGMITFAKGEANKILLEATEIAKAEIANEKLASIGNAPKMIAAIALESTLEERAKVIARKISVYRKILNP